MRPKSIYGELRRRRVFRTAAYYLVGAWVFLQVCDVVFPIVGLPDAALQFVLAATIIGFPIAIIIGWKYDITPQGIKRTPQAGTDTQPTDVSLKPADYVLLIALIGIALVVALQIQLPTKDEQALKEPPGESIAVLPFEVCKGDEADNLLASGLATQVINRLAERGKLKVIARESSFTFAGFGLELRQVAEMLGVQHVLTGILCREDNKLTLSTELSDANGFLVSSETFRQTAAHSARIPQTLASATAASVAAVLGDSLPAKSGALVDSNAYRLFIIGREHRARGNRKEARAAFERALEVQPNYAAARYEIALLEMSSSRHRHMGTQAAKARPIAERALDDIRVQLDAGLDDAQSHLVAGSIIAVLAYIDEQLAWRESSGLDAEKLQAGKDEILSRLAVAEQHFRTSINLNPANVEPYDWLAMVVEDQGRPNEALEILERARVMDPFNVYVSSTVAKRWVARGQYRQAVELLESFDELPRKPPGVWWWQLELMHLSSFWDEKCETLIDMLTKDPGAFEYWPNRWQAWWFVGVLAEIGLYEEAADWKSRIENMSMPAEVHESGLAYYLDAIGQGEIVLTESVLRMADMSDEEILDAFHEGGLVMATDLAETGDIDRAIHLLESIQHAPPAWAERKSQAPLALAELYKRVGRDKDAAAVLDRIRVHLEAEYANGIRHPFTLVSLAEIYLQLGRDEDAIETFEKAIDYHWIEPCDWDEETPWARIKNDPAIVSACRKMATDLEQQSGRVREMLSQHDPDELLAPLVGHVVID